MRLTVIGCGYLGAVHAAAMADLGHHVLGVETDPARLALLARGEAPFYEPGLDELLRRARGPAACATPRSSTAPRPAPTSTSWPSARPSRRRAAGRT